MRTNKLKLRVGKKTSSTKSSNCSGKDRTIRERYIEKITGKSSESLKASC